MNTRRIVLALAVTLATVVFAPAALAQTKAAKPLKITVYGGSGAIGSRIVAEAVARGHGVITAVAARPVPTRDFYVRLVKGVVEAQRAQKGAKTRYLVVGGASSLEVAPGKRLADTLPATLPEGTKNEIFSMVDALDWMRTVSDVPWTFFSPAGTIAAGTRTAKFRVGGDQLLKDDKGDSRISYEDYAVAMLDEVEAPRFANKRFTVAY